MTIQNWDSYWVPHRNRHNGRQLNVYVTRSLMHHRLVLIEQQNIEMFFAMYNLCIYYVYL